MNSRRDVESGGGGTKNTNNHSAVPNSTSCGYHAHNHRNSWLVPVFVVVFIVAMAINFGFQCDCFPASLEKFPFQTVRENPLLVPSSSRPRHLARLVSTSIKDVKMFYYKQTLDHFNFNQKSYTIFDQRYMINFKYWSGAKSNAPIFVYLGAEEAIDEIPNFVGFMIDNASVFKALLVYIEHRYYGKSVPFGSKEEAFKNASNLGYFNSAQALADYGEIIIHIQKTLDARNSPIVVIGGSYGGTWFRLKYPHLAIGALASSAPIIDFDDIIQPTAYMDAVSRGFKEASKSCYETIQHSWSEIDRIASEPNGLSILSKKFNTCSPIQSFELSRYLEHIYIAAAQYNQPPDYPVSSICKGVDEGSFKKNILDKIYSGILSYHGDDTCINSYYISADTEINTETKVGWRWQSCSEMVMPFGKAKGTMFQPSPFNLNGYTEDCENEYGVSPRPQWISTYYGGQNIKQTLKRSGGNIIFSNGLKDPYSSGGILEDLSESIVAVHTTDGSHCLDLESSQESDPEWLTEQRKREVQIIQGWIDQYYADYGLHLESKCSRNNILFHLVFMGFLVPLFVLL